MNLATLLTDVSLILCAAAIVSVFHDSSLGEFYGLMGLANLLVAVKDIFQADWAGAAINGPLGLFFLWLWWNRRKRDRAKRALGAKAKALIAGMTRKVREAGKPRRVLRPVPGGAQ